MQVRIPYGRTYLTAQIPDEIGVEYIEAPSVIAAPDAVSVVKAALDHPSGEIALHEFSDVSSVAIAVNDKTRPVPHQHLLPPLFERLTSLGIPTEAITLYVAVGTHPPMTEDQFRLILPAEICQRYRVVSHCSEDAGQLAYLGETTRGTPVWVNRNYYQAELKIVVGNIEPHQFAGFSGGVKSAAIGLAGFKTINHNHALMTHPGADVGVYDTNPARQDIEEIGEMIGVHLALNAILNQEKQIVEVLAGDPVAVMKAGISLSRKISQVAVPHKYNLIIASPGGHPKDINVYQSQKALAHAAKIIRSGGTILLAAACPEGAGSLHYEEWVAGKHSHAEVIEQFKAEGFSIGPHKAYQIARDALPIQLMLCTDMDEALARMLLFDPVMNFQTAVNTALASLPPGERVGVMPYAVSTVPYLPV